MPQYVPGRGPRLKNHWNAAEHRLYLEGVRPVQKHHHVLISVKHLDIELESEEAGGCKQRQNDFR